MPAKKKTSKSKTSNSKANKKVSAPRWVIAVVLLIVVGTGAFLVYQSFASTDGRYVTCRQGHCASSYTAVGNQDGKTCTQSFKVSNGRPVGFLCR